jgi:DNA polymerase V
VNFAFQCKNRIKDWVGIPVSIGIAPTKTLAKIANRIAKEDSRFQGVVILQNKRAINHYLKATPVEKIWGVGKRLSLKLKDLGVDNAFNLTQVRSRLIGDRFNVVLERTVRELKSQKCLDSNNIMEPKKQIMVSRSFGKSIRAAEKLRYENQKCRIITVFIRSTRYNKKISQIYASEHQQLAHPTNDSRIIIKIANNLMDKIYAEGYLYSKAGILLSDFTDSYGYQTDLFNDNYDSKESEILMGVIDFINLREIAKIGFGNQGYENTWRMKREMKSRRYTTKIEEIPTTK